MTRTPSSNNKRSGYINVGITALMYAQCELAANERGQALTDFVHAALRNHLEAHALEQHEADWRALCKRAAQENEPAPLRSEFNRMRGRV